MIEALLAWRAFKRTVASIYRFFPPWVWLTLLGVVLVLAFAYWHGLQVGHALNDARKEGAKTADAAWQKRFDDMKVEAEEWRGKAESAQAKLSQEERLRHEAETRVITDRADDLRVRGPGKAQACPGPVDHSSVPAASGQPGAGGGQSDDGGRGVPPEDWAAVPWGWLVNRAEQCDIDRSEVLTWRHWYSEQSKLRNSVK